MTTIEPNQPYVDADTGQAWVFRDGGWRRAEHPFVQHLRRRGGIRVEIAGEAHEVRLQAFRHHKDLDTEILGLSLSDVNVLLNADKEI